MADGRSAVPRPRPGQARSPRNRGACGAPPAVPLARPQNLPGLTCGWHRPWRGCGVRRGQRVRPPGARLGTCPAGPWRGWASSSFLSLAAGRRKDRGSPRRRAGTDGPRGPSSHAWEPPTDRSACDEYGPLGPWANGRRRAIRGSPSDTRVRTLAHSGSVGAGRQGSGGQVSPADGTQPSAETTPVICTTAPAPMPRTGAAGLGFGVGECLGDGLGPYVQADGARVGTGREECSGARDAPG